MATGAGIASGFGTIFELHTFGMYRGRMFQGVDVSIYSQQYMKAIKYEGKIGQMWWFGSVLLFISSIFRAEP